VDSSLHLEALMELTFRQRVFLAVIAAGAVVAAATVSGAFGLVARKVSPPTNAEASNDGPCEVGSQTMIGSTGGLQVACSERLKIDGLD
jgi:hypothetical protein